MNAREILRNCLDLLDERGSQYGTIEDNFETIAQIASLILDKTISKYDIAMILHAVKLARLKTSRSKEDNYLDGVNYLAIAGQLAPKPISRSSDLDSKMKPYNPMRGGSI
jgi:Domain of unknown function (DUF6378)